MFKNLCLHKKVVVEKVNEYYIIKKAIKLLHDNYHVNFGQQNHTCYIHITDEAGNRIYNFIIGKSLIKNKVCIKCGKCYNNVEKKAKKLCERIYNNYREYKQKEHKKQLAKMIWKNKCKKH